MGGRKIRRNGNNLKGSKRLKEKQELRRMKGKKLGVSGREKRAGNTRTRGHEDGGRKRSPFVAMNYFYYWVSSVRIVELAAMVF